MSWELVERASWLAGIVSALVAAVAAVMAARAAKGTTRDLALIVSVATDKPELLAAIEEDARRRAEAVKRRLRAVVVAAATAFALIATAGVLGLLLASLPDHVATHPVGGDMPRTVRECADAGEAAVCQDVFVYELADGAKVETRFAGVDRRGPREGLGRLTVEPSGRCHAEVRWRVTVGSQVVAEAVSREDFERAEFPVAGDQEYVFTAERPAGGGCDVVELSVRTGMSFDR